MTLFRLKNTVMWSIDANILSYPILLCVNIALAPVTRKSLIHFTLHVHSGVELLQLITGRRPIN